MKLIRSITLIAVLIAAAALPLQARKHLPLVELESVAKVGGNIIAIQGAKGSEDTIIATRRGLLFTLRGNGILDTPLLDIEARLIELVSVRDTRGIYDCVLSPMFATDSAVYITYTPLGEEHTLRLSRFTVPSGVERVILDIEFKREDILISQHNGGDLDFGPNGLLYMATGDGYFSPQSVKEGGVPSPQDLSSLEGKILRIDVSQSTDESPYTVPPDNPFLNDPNARPEVWALGLQQPNIAIDHETGEMVILDQVFDFRKPVQELNIADALTGGGSNFGWPSANGANGNGPWVPPTELDGNVVYPLFDGYDSIAGSSFSICSIYASDGTFFFADQQRGFTYFFTTDEDTAAGYQLGRSFNTCCEQGLKTTGSGADGLPYYADAGGTIYRSKVRTTIAPPEILPSSSSGGVVWAGGATIVFRPDPPYLAVHYTTDGSEPTLASPRWDPDNPSRLNENVSVKAFAYHPVTGASAVATQTFDLTTAPVSMQTIPINPYIEVEIRMTNVTPGAIIRYTTDGSAPTEASEVYDPATPLILSGPERQTVVAAGFHPVFGRSESRDTTHNPVIMTPSILDDVRIARPGQEVALTGTAGATIHFTTDGTPVDENSPIYSGPIRAEDASWIQALAVLEGYESQLETAVGVSVRIPIAASAESIAGGGPIHDQGSGTPAGEVQLSQPSTMVQAPDGTVYAMSRYDQFSSIQLLYTLTPEGIVKTLQFDEFRQQFTDIDRLPNGDLVLPRPDYPGVMILRPDSADEPIMYGRPGNRDYRDGPVEEALFVSPRFATVDAEGGILVNDEGRIRRITPDGIVETVAGAGFRRVEDDRAVLFEEVKFDGLKDIAVAPDGGLYLGDHARLLRADPFGVVTLIAGSSDPGHRDGRGEDAMLPELNEITVDRLGNVYVAAQTRFGSEDNSLQRISPQGEVVTIYPSTADGRGLQRTPWGILAASDGTVLAGSSDEIVRITLTDADGDGITDSEESGVLVVGEDDRLRDADGDGVSNAAEQLLGTNPNSSASVPPTGDIIRVSDQELAVLFATVPGSTYHLEGSETLTEWRVITEFDSGPFLTTLRFIHPESWRNQRYIRAVKL